MRDVDITHKGAVLLGPNVTCDGFHIDRRIRVQTHWHSDHLTDFGASKRRELVMTRGTVDLLTVRHPDLALRANVHVQDYGECLQINGAEITLESSSHCLGAVQVAVTLTDGKRVGYSGDFSYPIDSVIQVEELVVDATYGDPTSDRSYSQLEAEEALLEQVRLSLREGPVHILAHGGVTERALAVLHSAEVIHDVRVLAGKPMCDAVDIHRRANYPLPRVYQVDSDPGRHSVAEGRYLRCWGHGQSMANDALPGTVFRLTKFAADEVIRQEGDRLFRIGLSNHADFDGTMDYVERTGARFVLTDGSRSSPRKARALAAAITRDLEIDARPAAPQRTLHYGR